MHFKDIVRARWLREFLHNQVELSRQYFDSSELCFDYVNELWDLESKFRQLNINY